MKRHWRTGVGLGAAGLMALGLVAACSASAPGGGASGKRASIQNSCINPIEIQKQQIVSDQEIRFTMRNGDVMVNRLSTACYGLKSEGGFTWSLRGVSACSNQERITVQRIGTPCLLGEFTRYPKGTPLPPAS